MRRTAFVTVLSLVSASESKWIMKGISYGVSPDEGKLVNDDMFRDETAAQWGPEGRNDLGLMAELGANSVRLYGNDPQFSHQSFLDEAGKLHLGVIPGISDYPYVQSQENCAYNNDFNCHDAIKESYLQNLNGGFAQNGTYHPAMQMMISVNEPDLKLGSSPKLWAKAVISGIDGMLSAELEAGIVNSTMPITTTVSFSICSDCKRFNKKPGLGQMWTLRDAMRHPSKYGYEPKNNLAKFYKTRFVNSFNTGNPSNEVQEMFLNTYSKVFPLKHVFIAEYHCPSESTVKDLTGILKIAQNSTELLGVSFFEWMNRHDEGGHTDWGIFELGKTVLTQMTLNGVSYDVKCLRPSKDRREQASTIPASIAKVFGGSYEPSTLCEAIDTAPTAPEPEHKPDSEASQGDDDDSNTEVSPEGTVHQADILFP